LRRVAALLLSLFAALVALAIGAREARAANDPKLAWKTLETKHFRITYYSTEDEVATHVASLAESIFDRLVPPLGWAPGEITEILLTDQTDSANGSAVVLPYNAIRLNVTGPDDMSPLGDVDDWYLELVTHEYTHVLHIDHITGIPALVNRIIGKTLAPSQVLPRWLLEGLAVYEESTRTTGGRLRSSMWNMFMRADVLEHNVAPLDVFSNSPRRWPQGNIWYLYGSFFLEWLADTYGEDAIRAMIEDAGAQIIPFAVNRSIRRATGVTFEQMYPAWVDSMRKEYGAQVEAIRARGVREGVRVTHTGNTVQHPRWLPANAWPEHAGQLGFYVDDGHTTAGLWALPLVRDAAGRVTGSREDRRELVIRTSGVSGLSFMPDGTAVFSSGDVHENLFVYDDLFELPAHATSRSGLEGNRVRWSDGWRALDPSMSPDGRSVVFTTNHRGTTYLMMADVVAGSDRPGAHALRNVRRLVDGATFDQAFTPRWAPDGLHVAYSAWRRGGWRDIRLVDVRDLSIVEVTHDRAVDGGPSFSADGRWLFFHSDRTGVSNVYAYEVATGRLRQVTNSIEGAYQPEASPDGKSLAYVGYTHEGFDLFVMPLDESQWLDAPPYVDTRPPPPPESPSTFADPRDYNPLQTLLPRRYSVQITPGDFGQSSIVTASGSDIAGLHSIAVVLTTEWEHPEFTPDVSYTYSRLPFDVGARVYRSITPDTYSLGGNQLPWVRETTGVSTELSYSMPRAFDAQSFDLTYGFARVGASYQLPTSMLNPYDTPQLPQTGNLGTLHLGWSYSSAQSYLWSVGNEKGIQAGVTLDVSDPALASDTTGYAAAFNFAMYETMPWLRHHALALHAGGGVSGGDLGGHGPFYVGGFIDLPVVDVVRNNLIQGGIQLRGYPTLAEIGRYYALMNAEYRFPIVNVDRGPSTLPIFLNRISGAAFVDYGSAFNDPATAEFKTGVGAELWLDLTLGYVVGFTFRAGFAQGLASGGIGKEYFVAAVPF
jgi:Tol biopolymer transport system component